MGEVVGAALVAHVPTIMLPEDVRLEINEGKEITLVPGLRRMKTESNSVFSVSVPEKIRTCPRSASGFGEKSSRPLPMRTRAVGPSGVFARNAVPVATVSVMSGTLMDRLWTSYSPDPSSPRR